MKKLVMGLAACMLAVPALAFTPDYKAIEDDLIPNRYPEGSITTREGADRAIADVKQARVKLNELADYSTRRCYGNFFVNSCINDVRTAKMRQETRLRKVEAQAKAFIHEDKHRIEIGKQAERDRRAAAKLDRPQNPPRTAQPVPRPVPQPVSSQSAKDRSAARQQRHEEAMANAEASQAAREKRIADKQRKAEQRARRAQERAAKQVQRHEQAVADQKEERKARDQRMKERRQKNAQSARNGKKPQKQVKQSPKKQTAKLVAKQPVENKPAKQSSAKTVNPPKAGK
ncbi:MAG TPA: hypothetical protein DCZ56_05105 [Sutterella sp.]|nr:hypothetical protein [Sutterella sp.]